jgi:hypothetical protein
MFSRAKRAQPALCARLSSAQNGHNPPFALVIAQSASLLWEKPDRSCPYCETSNPKMGSDKRGWQMRFVSTLLFVGLVTLSFSCTTSDREQADRKAAEAKVKAQQAARKADAELRRLGQQAKAEAHAFDANAHRALQGAGPTADGRPANLKLDEAGEKAREAGRKTAVVLDRAALIARVKSKLAADAGLSTLADVSVDTSGHVITLKGTVNSEQQKRLAEEAAMQVNGVSKVVDDLSVRE